MMIMKMLVMIEGGLYEVLKRWLATARMIGVKIYTHRIQLISANAKRNHSG